MKLRTEINKLVSSYGISKNADLVDWLIALFKQRTLKIVGEDEPNYPIIAVRGLSWLAGYSVAKKEIRQRIEENAV